MLRNLLDQQQADLLQKERALLEDLRVTLARLDATPEDQRRLALTLRQLEELFLLVIVGEFNAGKSAFINALLGQKLLAEGVTPTTNRINVLRYGAEQSQTLREEDVLVLTLPVAWLEEINVVDTPGTNAVIQRHQEITEDFVPRSDLVLFITSADRPFSESERTFLSRIRDWGKKVVIVINKIDIFEQEDDIQQITQFVEDNAQTLLGVRPQIFPVSARLAQKAKTVTGVERTALWQASRFGPLEEFILSTLDQRQRVRLKLENPLGVAARLQEQYQATTQARITLLTEDFRTIDTIDSQLGAYEEDMRHDFKYQLSHVDNVLHEMSARGMEFFDDTVRVARVFDLVNTSKVKGEFEEKVIANAVQEIETQVGELIDWLVERDFKQWQGVMDYLNRRAEQHQDRIVGQLGGQFEFNRRELLASVGRAAREVVAGYDRIGEARQLADSVQMAVAQTAIAEVGALGLGTVLVVILHTTLADVSGVLAAGAVAALGLYILPTRRRKAKADLKTKMETLRGNLAASLSTEFEQELSRSVRRIREAMAPYTRFVRSERTKLSEIESHLLQAASDLRALRAQVQEL
ncbi:MAG: dynamin family protein [Anaerolineae bacterium]